MRPIPAHQQTQNGISLSGIRARGTALFAGLPPLAGADCGSESSTVNLSAMTSTTVRVAPSRPVNVRNFWNPSTRIVEPLRRDRASSANPFHNTTRCQVTESTYPAPRFTRSLTARLRSQTALPVFVKRISGSRPNRPVRIVLFTDHPRLPFPSRRISA